MLQLDLAMVLLGDVEHDADQLVFVVAAAGRGHHRAHPDDAPVGAAQAMLDALRLIATARCDRGMYARPVFIGDRRCEEAGIEPPLRGDACHHPEPRPNEREAALGDVPRPRNALRIFDERAILLAACTELGSALGHGALHIALHYLEPRVARRERSHLAALRQHGDDEHGVLER
ncbi:MAG TPA: hypothetical protein VGO62_18185, partial [Myxococcota bacterium]